MVFDSIIYKKKCIGKNGKGFILYKIRTMYPNADKDLEKAISNGMDEIGKIKKDHRITPIGKILRKYFLDELPQVYNLLRGDISLVGIRAYNEKNPEICFDDIKEVTLKYKPGLFGIQYAYKSSSFEEYIDNIRKYFKEKENKPIATDIKYLSRILFNIFFRGTRSK